MTLPLSELIRGLPELREADAHPEVPETRVSEIRVSGVRHDSRRVSPGDLFVAIPGERFDGRDFALQAEAAGAVAVVGRGEAPSGLTVPWIRGRDPRALLGPLAARVYERPDRELTLVGVTGTNGKSTVATLAAAVLEASGHPTGVLGSLGYRFDDWEEPAERTTPEASDLLRLLRRMRDGGATAAAMEVSSHALALERVDELRFDVAVFTNLTRDHLDFHGDLESYFAAKGRLFRQLKQSPREGTAVVCTDDHWGRRLSEEISRREGRLLTYGLGTPPDAAEVEVRDVREADVRARDLELSEGETRFSAVTPRGELPVKARLLGRFNAANLLAAVAVGEALELPHDAVSRGLAEQSAPAGRMEPVDRGQPFPIYVDYSHTPAALEAALRSLREFTGRKIIVVFGCGGDRDPGKREPMGRIAGKLADLPIVTSDNPRSEDPLAIIRSVEDGLKKSGNPSYRVMPDRREAIRRAIAVAGPESAVLVAGKGSESVQVIGDREERFFDREEIERALEERFGSQKPG